MNQPQPTRKLPVQGRSQLIGQTGILMAFAAGNAHPLSREHTLTLEIYGIATGLVICISEDVENAPCGLEPSDIGVPVAMDRLAPYAQRFIQTLPTTKQFFDQIVRIFRDEFADAQWHVITEAGYRAACQQLHTGSRN